MGIYDREYYRDKTRGSGWLSGEAPACKAIIAINVAALYMSNSRTSMAALLLAIGAASLLRPTAGRLAALFLGICCAILFFSIVIVFNLMLVNLLDHPYKGLLKIEPSAFTKILKHYKDEQK